MYGKYKLPSHKWKFVRIDCDAMQAILEGLSLSLLVCLFKGIEKKKRYPIYLIEA